MPTSSRKSARLRRATTSTKRTPNSKPDGSTGSVTSTRCRSTAPSRTSARNSSAEQRASARVPLPQLRQPMVTVRLARRPRRRPSGPASASRRRQGTTTTTLMATMTRAMAMATGRTKCSRRRRSTRSGHAPRPRARPRARSAPGPTTVMARSRRTNRAERGMTTSRLQITTKRIWPIVPVPRARRSLQPRRRAPGPRGTANKTKTKLRVVVRRTSQRGTVEMSSWRRRKRNRRAEGPQQS
mmetsp:Transcript_24808/g.61320  ORF Transcript_24808/g.61320 Transcript_24808/m.61320 type:complete len:241 (-) Transcript_24808:472-1194(-)